MGIAGSSAHIAKKYGCDEIINYRDKSMYELTGAIKQAAGGKIRYAFDCISEGGTLQAISDAFKEHGGTISTCWSGVSGASELYFGTDMSDALSAYVLTYDDKTLSKLPKGVKAVRTLVATAHGEDSDFAKKYFRLVGQWIDKGEFKAQRTTLIPEGLVGVAEGLRRLQEGETRGEKFVYRIEDTPRLKDLPKKVE